MDTSRSGVVRPRRRFILFAAILAMIVGASAAYWLWPRGPGAAPRSSVRAPVPVSVAVATRQDLPIYLTGIGAVQASFTVKIAAQVDGKLQEVLFTEGQRVKKGDVLAKIDPRLFQAALDQAKAKKAQNQALLVAAEKDLVRSKTLAQKDFASQQNVDLQQSKVDQLKAAIAADEAAIETAQTQLDYTTITAPSDGRIGIRLVDPGNLVRANDAGAIATLMLVQPAAVLFTLPSRALADLRAAMARGPVEVIAFDQNNRQALATGKLLLIDNAIDQATSTMRLKAMFANADERLWPGDFVNARLLLETQANVLAVPSSTGDLTVVAAGLREGDRVVTDGHYKLVRNAPVSFAAPQSAEAGRAK